MYVLADIVFPIPFLVTGKNFGLSQGQIHFPNMFIQKRKEIQTQTEAEVFSLTWKKIVMLIKKNGF